MSLPLHKDLTKRNKDLLTKDIPDKSRVEWKGKTSNGVETEIFFEKDSKGTVGTYKPKYNIKSYGTEVTLELNTKRDAKVEVALKDKIASGLKVTVSEQFNAKDGLFTVLSAEYKHEFATVDASIDYGKTDGSIVKGAGVFGSSGFLLGLSGEYIYAGSASKVDAWSATAGYSNSEFDAAGFLRRVMDKNIKASRREAGASYYHQVSNDFTVGAELVFNVDQKEVAPVLKGAVQYKPHSDSVLKAVLVTDGQVSIGYKQKFNDRTTFTVGTSVNAFTFSKDSTSVGFTLALAD